jgi:RNA polymerase sigma-70 factor (ECF subfamily)
MTTGGRAESPKEKELVALVALHREAAFRVARRLVHSDAEAEDLTQTAILNVLRRAGNIEDVSNVKAYLLTSVRNLWRNQLRQQGRRRFVGADAAEHLAATDAGPEERALTNLDASLAREAFHSLSGTSREILRLRYVDGLGFLELAGQLGITPVAARQRAHRAREELVGACIEHTATTGHGPCRAVRSKLGRYLRGRLSRNTRAQIAAHLDRCRGCSDCLDELKELYGFRLEQEEGDR